MNTTSYGPESWETPADIMTERFFIAGDFLCGVGYGMQFVLLLSCSKFLWVARRSRGRQSLLLLCYIIFLFLIATLFAVAQARTVEDMYVDHRNYPDGPWRYFLDTQNLPQNVIFYATLFIMTFLSDLLVLWRCWVIWSAAGRTNAYLVIAFPSLMVLASFVMGTLWTLQSSQPGLSLYSALPMAYGTSYYIISLSINIVLTVLITIRLLLYRRKIASTLTADHARHYFSLATIIVESAALYSIFALLFIITYAANNPINQIFLGVSSSAQQIAGLLIVYRIAEGTAWRQSTFLDQENLQTLRFGGPNNRDVEAVTSIEASHIRTGSSALETPVDGHPLGFAFRSGRSVSPGFRSSLVTVSPTQEKGDGSNFPSVELPSPV